MECSDVKNQCQPFLDNELKESLSHELEQHLNACAGCKQQVESQRDFHFFMKNVLLRSAANPAGSTALKHRILSVLGTPVPATASPRAVNLFNPRATPMRGAVATAAACMFFLTGFVGYQSVCVTKQCSVVHAARHEHANIVSGNRPTWARDCEPEQLNRSLREHGKKLVAAAPNLSECHLRPECCGKLSLPGMPEGVFIQYVECCPGPQAVTLMIIDTPANPLIDNYKDYLTTEHARHRVISWRRDEKGPLFMLVTKMPLNEAMRVADAIRH